MQLTKTSALSKLRKLEKRIRIVRGGSSAGKTIAILLILIDYAIKNAGKEISIVSETIPHLRRGALKDFLNILKGLNRYDDNKYNKSTLKYEFSNGSYLEFFSTDQPDRLRGARRTDLFINECSNVSFDSYQELSIRTSGNIWLDYNPANLFWVDKELIGQPDTEFVTLTYKDNSSLPKSIVKEIEKAKEKAKTSTYWANWWKVYGLGQIGSLQGSVFENWRLGDFNPDHIPTIYGQDYGYSNDPTTLIEVAIDKKKKLIYAKELLYKTKLTTSEIANINIRHAGDSLIVGDSAEPRLIQEVRSKGCNLVATKKGKDSILTGIKIMQDYDIVVDHKSSNMVKELNNYRWLDKGNKPCDDHNHLIDALRYAVFYQLSNPNKGMYYIS